MITLLPHRITMTAAQLTKRNAPAGTLARAALCAACALLLVLAPLAARAQDAGRANWPKTLRFGINPWGSQQEMRDMFRPLMDYLGAQLGITIEIVIPTTYEELLERTASGELDLISFNSVSFLKARRKGLPITYLATQERLYEGESQPRDSYTGYIVVRRDSPYRTLADLKGRKFAFVEENSASGYKMPVAILGTQYNVTPDKFFKKYFFVGDHNEVMSAVYYKCVDGGATWDNSYSLNTVPAKFGNNFRIIAKTPPIPNDAWAAGAAVPPAMRDRIRDILLATDASTRNAAGKPVIDPARGFPGTGWRKRSPAFYDEAAPLLLYDETSE